MNTNVLYWVCGCLLRVNWQNEVCVCEYLHIKRKKKNDQIKLINAKQRSKRKTLWSDFTA